MVKEARRYGSILSTIAQVDAEITIYQAGAPYRTGLERREACLRRLLSDITAARHRRLLLEREDGTEERDKRLIYERVSELGCREQLWYGHDTAAHESLLCIPDAVAWAYARGGEPRRRVRQFTRIVRL